jgi:hypothetical protein
MPRWKENHYARAAEFARQLGAALGRAPVAPESPAPTASAPPAGTAPSAAKPAAPGPTAAAVFTAIPWKK